MSFKEALIGYENLDGLKAGEYFGFHVDAGLACICEKTLHQAFCDYAEARYGANPDLLAEKFEAFIRSWVNEAVFAHDTIKDDKPVVYTHKGPELYTGEDMEAVEQHIVSAFGAIPNVGHECGPFGGTKLKAPLQQKNVLLKRGSFCLCVPPYLSRPVSARIGAKTLVGMTNSAVPI